MKSQLERQVENDVKRVETAIGQDINLDYWRIRQVANMQQAQHQIRAWWIGAAVIVIWMVLFAVILAGMGQ